MFLVLKKINLRFSTFSLFFEFSMFFYVFLRFISFWYVGFRSVFECLSTFFFDFSRAVCTICLRPFSLHFPSVFYDYVFNFLRLFHDFSTTFPSLYVFCPFHKTFLCIFLLSFLRLSLLHYLIRLFTRRLLLRFFRRFYERFLRRFYPHVFYDVFEYVSSTFLDDITTTFLKRSSTTSTTSATVLRRQVLQRSLTVLQRWFYDVQFLAFLPTFLARFFN